METILGLVLIALTALFAFGCHWAKEVLKELDD